VSESSLSVKYDDLLLEVGKFLGYGVVPSKWSSEQSVEVDMYVQAGVRQFYYPPAIPGIPAGYEWSFIRPHASMELDEDNAVVALPDDFGRICGSLHYSPTVHCQPVEIVSESRLQSLSQRSSSSSRPQVAAVRRIESDGTDGQRFEIVFWPTPGEDYTLAYRYEAYAGKLSSDHPYPLGGMRFSGLIIESCLSVAEQRANDEKGLHWDQFAAQLVGAIEQDRKSGARVFGFMGEPSEFATGRRRGCQTEYPVTYKGATW